MRRWLPPLSRTGKTGKHGKESCTERSCSSDVNVIVTPRPGVTTDLDLLMGKGNAAASEKVVPITREELRYLEPSSHGTKPKVGVIGTARRRSLVELGRRPAIPDACPGVMLG
jgi:hypothetical protein